MDPDASCRECHNPTTADSSNRRQLTINRYIFRYLITLATPPVAGVFCSIRNLHFLTSNFNITYATSKLLIKETTFGNRNGVLQVMASPTAYAKEDDDAMASPTAYAKEDATSKEGTKGIRVDLFLSEEGTSENQNGRLLSEKSPSRYQDGLFLIFILYLCTQIIKNIICPTTKKYCG